MKYKVTYKSSEDGDCCSVWTEASDPQQAASNVRDEYWDCEEIISVSKLR